jgi:pyruvate dehydrogenase (quinone)
MDVAELFVETLHHAGVRRVWGLPGDSLNGFTDALRRHGGIAWLHVRHEESAAFAAAADAALTGELAVVAGSCGPGSVHFVNGLYDAQRSRVPVLAIASHIPSEEVGTGYFQETRPQELFRECSVYSEVVSNPAQLPYVLESAVRAAVERRGVAVVVVPGDVFFEEAPDRRLSAPIGRAESTTVPDQASLEAAAALLGHAERVTILAGAGVAGAHAEVLRLAERLGAPIVHALRGKEHIAWDNPYDVGMTGLLGTSAGYHAVERCDVLLMLGTDFPYRAFYPRHATVVQVDVRGEQIGRRTHVDLALVGDVRSTVASLLPLVPAGSDGKHLRHCRRLWERDARELDRHASDDGHRPIHPQLVARLLSELARDDAVFTVDVGSPVIWAARHLQMNGRRRLIGSFNHGSMANALPHALGAQAAAPGREVIALAGDGGLSMLLGDLLSIRQNDLPVKVVVLNNSSLNFVELEMKSNGIVNFGTDLLNPDFAEVAQAVGIPGTRVEDPADLRGSLAEALDRPGPALVDVVVARQELTVPPGVTAAQAKGFALYALRTLLSGRGDELLDLADTNVVRRLFDSAGD